MLHRCKSPTLISYTGFILYKSVLVIDRYSGPAFKLNVNIVKPGSQSYVQPD